MKSLYITRAKNGKLCLCCEATKKDGTACVLYLCWQFGQLYCITPDPKAMVALKVGERQELI